MSEPIRVLFLCTHNSARSQIAEALLERKRGGRFEVASAGTEPATALHPLALRALKRAGIDWSDRTPKDVDSVLGSEWDLVITVCDRARESCPRIPGQPVIADWGIPDPAEAEGTEGERESVFWESLTMLSRRIDLLCALPDEKLQRLALKGSMDALGAERGPTNGTET